MIYLKTINSMKLPIIYIFFSLLLLGTYSKEDIDRTKPYDLSPPITRYSIPLALYFQKFIPISYCYNADIENSSSKRCENETLSDGWKRLCDVLTI